MRTFIRLGEGRILYFCKVLLLAFLIFTLRKTFRDIRWKIQRARQDLGKFCSNFEIIFYFGGKGITVLWLYCMRKTYLRIWLTWNLQGLSLARLAVLKKVTKMNLRNINGKQQLSDLWLAIQIHCYKPEKQWK